MTLPAIHNKSLVNKFADKYSVDPDKLLSILKATAFKQPGKANEPAPEVSNEQMAALLIVADQYELNPFTREIYAFPDKGKGIVPVVGVDGWSRIINGNPFMDGLEFNYSETLLKIDEDAKECPEWVECIIYRKDRSKTYVVREYLDECYRPPFKGQYGKVIGPWQTHTKRFLRHKALIQCARIAFGFAGICDEDEAKGFVGWADANVHDIQPDQVLDTAPFMQALDQFGLPDDANLNDFINSVANQNRISPEKVKVEAASDMHNFIEHFNKWNSSRLPAADEGQPASQKTEPKPQRRQKPAAEQEGPGDAGKITCPNTNKLVDELDCPGCPKRAGCPAWED